MLSNMAMERWLTEAMNSLQVRTLSLSDPQREQPAFRLLNKAQIVMQDIIHSSIGDPIGAG